MAKPTTALTVLRTEQLTPHMVRVFLGGPGFESFTPSEYSDSYVKIEFGTPDQPTLRTYTIRSYDLDAKEIAIDFCRPRRHGCRRSVGRVSSAGR
ncbi:MAG: NADPH-dependent ferric siderophore reductase [Rhodococcus sp. (in: high G+C Gram-positive bacteria)]